jgi:hypothetical protein
MVRISSIAFLCFLVSVSTIAAKDEVSWTEMKGKHFVVYYAGKKKFATEVLANAEKLYGTITKRLGFTRYGDFWIWDDRAKIWIYATRDDFITAEKAPGWAAGKASVKTRELKAYETSADFCETVLPHELSHLIFREFTGLGSDVPLWLDEGVAQLQEKDRKESGLLLKEAALKGKLIPLSKLMLVRPEQLDGMGPAIFYAQSLSLVEFIVDKYGATSFRKFCGKLKSGKSVNDALRFTYPASIRNITDLQQAWLKHLEEAK